jgi:glycerol uptake facilitator protein/aquaporin Z
LLNLIKIRASQINHCATEFDETEMARLIAAITTINAWNRFGVATRMVPALPRAGFRGHTGWARAADEFALTTVLLFGVVTMVRWLRDPASAIYIADLDDALVAIGIISGILVTALMFSRPGKRSGAHMNPAVTVALWLMDVVPGRRVPLYVVAQLAGSAAGTGLGRLVWGPAVALPSVAIAAIKPSPTWQAGSVFLAEVGAMFVLIVVAGFLMAHPRRVRLLPYAIGLAVGLVIALLGARSGGSINPARQFGPAALSGQTIDLWIYLTAPVLGAFLGAAVHHLLKTRFNAYRNHPEGVRPCEPN